MYAVAVCGTREGHSGPDIFWLVPILLLFPLAIVSLFSFVPIWMALAFSAGFAAVLVRSRLPEWLSVPASVATLITTLALAIGLIEANTRYSYFHGEHYGPHYPVSVAPWFNIAHRPSATEPVSASLLGGAPQNPTGDLLLRTPVFERGHRRDILRCDLRCVYLLKNANVTSVTIQPTVRVWHEGPRALMPNYVPQPRTFWLSKSDTCKAAWDRIKINTRGTSSGDTIADFHRALNRDEQCLFSKVSNPNASFDRVIETEFEIEDWSSYRIPPGAVI